MTTATAYSMTDIPTKKKKKKSQRPIVSVHVPTSVQILSMVLYAGFAIPVSIVALVQFWPAGIALAGFFAYQWGRVPSFAGGSVSEQVEALKPQLHAQEPETTGNATFDAYRGELLNRLEQEQQSFEGFLTRLRAAKDKSEFDQFMDERAAAATQSLPRD